MPKKTKHFWTTPSPPLSLGSREIMRLWSIYLFTPLPFTRHVRAITLSGVGSSWKSDDNTVKWWRIETHKCFWTLLRIEPIWLCESQSTAWPLCHSCPIIIYSVNIGRSPVEHLVVNSCLSVDFIPVKPVPCTNIYYDAVFQKDKKKKNLNNDKNFFF